MCCSQVSLQFTGVSLFYPGKTLNSTSFYEKHQFRHTILRNSGPVTYLMAVDILPHGLTINGWWWCTWPASPGNCIFKEVSPTLRQPATSFQVFCITYSHFLLSNPHFWSVTNDIFVGEIPILVIISGMISPFFTQYISIWRFPKVEVPQIIIHF